MWLRWPAAAVLQQAAADAQTCQLPGCGSQGFSVNPAGADCVLGPQVLKPVLPPKPEVLLPSGAAGAADAADADVDMADGAAANGGSAEAHWTDEVVDMVRTLWLQDLRARVGSPVDGSGGFGVST